LAREVDAALARLSAGGDAHEADGGPHEAWSSCMAIKISGAGLSGNNDERTAERSGRSAASSTFVEHRRESRDPHRAAYTRDLRAGDERPPEKRGR
jgi:hypothetical protein